MIEMRLTVTSQSPSESHMNRSNDINPEMSNTKHRKYLLNNGVLYFQQVQNFKIWFRQVVEVQKVTNHRVQSESMNRSNGINPEMSNIIHSKYLLNSGVLYFQHLIQVCRLINAVIVQVQRGNESEK